MEPGSESGGYDMGMPTEAPLPPEMQQVARLIQELQKSLTSAATPEEKARIEQELRVVLEGYFTMDIERRVRELDKIQASVAKMEAALQKRLALQSDWIELQLKQILFQANGVNISVPGVSTSNSRYQNSSFGSYNDGANSGSLSYGAEGGPGTLGAVGGPGYSMETASSKMGYDFRFGITRILPRSSLAELPKSDPLQGYAKSTSPDVVTTEEQALKQDNEKLKRILLAFHMFLSQFQHMPSSQMRLTYKHPPHSWRVAILPLLGYGDLYNEYRFDEPWDSPQNSKLINRMPSIYKTGVQPESKVTPFKIPVGKGAFDYGDGTQPQIQDFLDGTSNTIAAFKSNEFVIWTKPEDEVITKERLPKLATDQLIGLADGSVHFLDPSATPEQLRALVTRDGGEVVDRAILLRQPLPTPR